jgi:PAS domain S-box-containing protein
VRGTLHLDTEDETMKRTTQTTFPSDPRSAGAARRFAARTLDDWGAHDLSDPALLLVSEVVTNGVVHARTPIKVQLELHEDRLLVEVWDKAPSNVQRREAAREDTGGRGLMIVEALSARWGTRRDGGGKCVWFEVARAKPKARRARRPAVPPAPDPRGIQGESQGESQGEIQQIRGAGLAGVLSAAPTAVLLVDLAARTVTYANPAALRLLEPAPQLPVGVEEWSKAAGLAEPDGEPLGPERSPLARLADRQEVPGEAVTLDTRDGRRLLWVLGWALPDLPEPAELTDTGVVAFFDVTGLGANLDAGEPLRDLRERAILATERSFSISDPHQPDNPLVYVNPAFERMTGYAADDAVGRNCRFLQGEDTDQAAVAELRAALAGERQATVTLRNYRKDGTAFWNEVAISPVLDGLGRLTHFVGVQSDVTARVTAELERERLYQAEQEARAQAETTKLAAEAAHAAAEAARMAAEAARVEAEETQHRLGLLAEATSLLTTSLDVDTTLRRLTRLVVPIFADWSVVDLLEESGQVRRVGVGHLDPRMASRLLELEQRTPIDLGADTPTTAVLRGEPAKLVTGITDDWLVDKLRTPELLAAYRQAGPVTSAIVVPLRARGRVLGALTLIGIGAGRHFGEADLRLAEDLGRRAGLAVDNARSYERELRVAETLQRNLLPHRPPELPGFESAVRYVPGSAGVKVGGDWYDVIPGQDGSAVVVVGDVMGHDLHAAALMGRLRSAMRAYAIEDDRPATLITRLDRLVQRLEPGELVTMVVARIAPDGTSLTYANAGHPPPLLVAPDGRTRFLEEARSVLVGVSPTVELAYEEASISIDPGATLLLYTDGLVEDRDAELGQGLEALADEAGRRVNSRLETLCDAVLARLDAPRRRDDIALLAIRSGQPPSRSTT